MIISKKNRQEKDNLLIEKLVFHGKKFPKEKRAAAVNLALKEFKKLTNRDPSELISEIYLKVIRKLNDSDKTEPKFENPLKSYNEKIIIGA